MFEGVKLSEFWEISRGNIGNPVKSDAICMKSCRIERNRRGFRKILMVTNGNEGILAKFVKFDQNAQNGLEIFGGGL